MSWNAFLDEVRTAAQAAAGLPDGAVSVYQQQDLLELVDNAIASHHCAVLVGLTGGRANPDRQTATKWVGMTLEIEVWTAKVLMSGQTLTSLTVAEYLISGMHGWRPADVPAANGGTRVPSFRSLTLRPEREPQSGAEYLVANLQFEVPLVPQPLP